MARATNNEREAISELTTGRLSVYLRCLIFLESEGQKTISSQELADRFHLNSAQIRKDLACFGEFGTRGVGYNVSRLRQHLVETLGIDQTRNLIIVGAGNLGRALADYAGFNTNGFRVVALLDTDPAKVGQRSREGVPIMAWGTLRELVEKNRVDIGIIAVTPEAAQEVSDALAEAGIHAILNFAPVQIRLRDDVKVRSVDLRINLESLSFHLRNIEEGATIRTAG
jgi:redox-sensing transcriptional repressor